MSDGGTPAGWDAERALLGALLSGGAPYAEVASVVGPQDFGRASHGALFALLGEMTARGNVVDIVAVIDEVVTRDAFDRYGGAPYLLSLPQAAASPDHAIAYARRVRDHAIRREATLALQKGLEELSDGAGTPEVLAGRIDALQGAQRRLAGDRRFARFGDHAAELEADARWAAEHPGVLRGLSTGLSDVDALLGGMAGGRMYVVAARPAMGKSALAQGIAHHVARTAGPVGFFALEMDAKQLAMRAACAEGRVNAERIERGTGDGGDWRRFAEGLDRSAALDVLIDDTGGLTLTELRARARAMVKQGARLLIVDYMQLVRVPGETSEERVVAEVSMGLLALAKELDVPVLALAQLNRSLESRTDKRPVMSDLRHSGQIEQDAHAVVMLYRDEVYDPESPDKGIAEVIVRKNRGGRIGTARVAFVAEFALFQGLARGGGW